VGYSVIMDQRKQSKSEELLIQMVERAALIAVTKKRREPLALILVNLTRLAVKIGVAGKSASDISEIAEELVINLGDLLKDSRGRNVYGNYVSEMMADLNRLAVITGTWESPRESPYQPHGQRLAKTEVTYWLKGSGEDLKLYEKAGGKSGLGISKNDYLAAVKTLCEAIGQPEKFEMLHKRFVKHGGMKTHSKYPLRVILRFWQLSDPPLIHKDRARYAPLTSSMADFRHLALDVFRKLPGG